SNVALHGILRGCLEECGLPPDGVQLVATPDREAVGHLLKMNEWIDLVVPRGGEGLIRRVAAEATMPALKHYKGVCHAYIEPSAPLDMARRIVLNAKCQRPGVCNAAEALLVDAPLAESFLPGLGLELQERGVELRGCPRTCALVRGANPATDEDYAT